MQMLKLVLFTLLAAGCSARKHQQHAHNLTKTLKHNTPGGYMVDYSACNSACSHGCDFCKADKLDYVLERKQEGTWYGWPNAIKKRDSYIQNALNNCANTCNSQVYCHQFEFEWAAEGCVPPIPAPGCIRVNYKCRALGPPNTVTWSNTGYPPIPVVASQWHSAMYYKA